MSQVKKMIFNGSIFKLQVKNINPAFLYIFMMTKYFTFQKVREVANNIINYNSLPTIKNFLIPLFDSSFQAEIEKIVKDSHHKLEQSKSLYKEAEGLLYESLGSPNLACSEGNSSLGNHCIDLAFSHEARTQSPLSLCKNAKNSTSKTADTRILRETQSDSAKDSDENNPVFANAMKQSISQINPHEVRTLKGVVGGGERLRGEGLDFAIKAPSPLAEKAMSDSKITAESRRSERVESFTKNTESQGDSSHSMQSTLQNLKAKFSHLNINIKPLSKSLQKSGRLDSEYYQAKYENIEALIKSYKGGFCRLKDLIKSYSTGFAFSSDDYLESGNLALIRINNIKNENLDMSNAIYLRDNAKDLSPKDKVKQGDILISMSGSIGLSCVIRENIEAMVNQRIFKISIENFSCDVLVLLLNSIFCKMQFDRIGTGGVQTNISNKDIENILIPLLDSQTQEQIASRLKLSFALKKEAKELLDLAKSKVECAIEGKIS